jgi:hypothetical protein
MMMVYLSQPEGRKSFGVSDSQHQEMLIISRPPKDGEVPEIDALKKQLQESQNAKDTQKASEIGMQIGMTQMRFQSKRFFDAVPPEVQQKFKETQLATIESNPFVASSAYEALGISAEQKKKIDAAYKELEPTVENTLGGIIDAIPKMNSKINDYLEKNSPVITDGKEFSDKMNEARKYLADNDPEFKKITDDIKNSLKQMTVQCKFKIYDLLTDEQLKKLQDLTDNPPEYIQFANKRLKELQESVGMREGSSGGSQDFLNSWKPGEPIPPEYKEHRKQLKKFPGTE